MFNDCLTELLYIYIYIQIEGCIMKYEGIFTIYYECSCFGYTKEVSSPAKENSHMNEEKHVTESMET